MRTPAAGADRDRAAGGRAGLGTRRRAGITVLAALLLVLIGVAPVPGRHLPGDPTAAPVPAAPQEGDCIARNPHYLGADPYPPRRPGRAAQRPMLRSPIR